VAELGLGPVLLAGQDWGGSTAFAFAAAHPDEVRRLAVLEAMPAVMGVGGERVFGAAVAENLRHGGPTCARR
jgi:pimeloyl-ACP methyl ester carboxylesterase